MLIEAFDKFAGSVPCGSIEVFGFALNSCTWSWKWTLDSKEAIVFQVCVCFVYAIMVSTLQSMTKSKDYQPPKWLDGIRFTHNIMLSLVSLWMFIVQVSHMYEQRRFENWQSIACVNTPNTGLYGFANFVYLVSKIWEWADTVFLILTKKDVIFLHYFHHMTTFTMAAVVHNFPVGGYCFINCFVHAIMYLHYAYPVRWARSLITSTQLTQFVIVISIHTYGYLNPSTCFDMSPVFLEWAFNETVVVGFFVLFVNFFIQQYLLKRKDKSKLEKIA